jgi:hypothetical protein
LHDRAFIVKENKKYCGFLGINYLFPEWRKKGIDKKKKTVQELEVETI